MFPAAGAIGALSGGGGGGYSVNPSSSTQAASNAGGGVGAATFNFGGNPNVQSFAQSKTWPLVIGLVAFVGLIMLVRR